MDASTIAEIFAEFGPVRVRRVFGGHGIYADDLVFALELRGEIFLKSDAETDALFEAEGSTPFTYERKRGGTTKLPYWRMPVTAFDDPDELKRWCNIALAASRRAALAVPKKLRRPRGAPKAGRALAKFR
jgi:DNA transformation protein